MNPSHHQPMLNQQGQGTSISQLPLPAEHGRAEEMKPSHHHKAKGDPFPSGHFPLNMEKSKK
ncbi:hypothetical protein E4185_19025 [Aeromonas media]|uniref:hypothetical protein n=1 Tax=Aeromonas media TaxID=651 RepID=UPI00148AE819|nr:hypothetical protein [Aeromonas media]QJT27926.1 hypothetical protein E4185_19025 [Aeromonas media]